MPTNDAQWIQSNLDRLNINLYALAAETGLSYPYLFNVIKSKHSVQDGYRELLAAFFSTSKPRPPRNWDWLERELHESGLTSWQIARLSGVAWSAVSKIMSGKRTARDDTYDRLSDWIRDGKKEVAHPKSCYGAHDTKECGEAFVRRMLERDFEVTLIPQGHKRPVTVRSRSFGDYLNNGQVVPSREYQPAVCIMDGKHIQA